VSLQLLLQLLLLLLPLLLVGIGGLWLLDRVIADQRVGLQVVVAMAVLRLLVPLPDIFIGAVSVKVDDLVLVLLVTALLARAVRGWSPTTLQLSVLLLLVIVAWSVVRGMLDIDLFAPVNQARPTLYLIAVVLYASFLGSDRPTREDVARLWTLYATGVLGVALIRWAIVFGGLPGRGAWYEPAYYGLRVIYSNETLAVAVAFVMLLPPILRGEATRRQWQLATAFGGAVVVLQHRSVLAVMLLGGALMLLRHRQRLSRRIVYGGATGALVMAVALVTLLDGGELAAQAASADAAGPEELLLGRPYGSGFERVLPTGERVDVAPHNMYLELLLRVGVIGLGLYLAVGIILWRQLRRHQPVDGSSLLDDSTLSVVLVMFALYMIPYNLFTETGIIVGLALSAWRALASPLADVSTDEALPDEALPDEVLPARAVRRRVRAGWDDG
jgi:hypothetical protein